MTNSTLQKLGADPKIIEVPSKTTLLREGDPGEHFYVVLEGQVEAVKRMGTEEEQFLSVRGPGEFISEISLLHRDVKRTASIVAREKSQLLELTRDDFDTLLTHEPMMAYEMVRALTLSLNASNERHISD
ncbi:MAG TPA: cyclic nucleotide-binding domain-containing protein [Anaerolineae bacterium]|nr:cyclic nucleotide-binding domain-containing protein [Anaerolineae bacterium]